MSESRVAAYHLLVENKALQSIQGSHKILHRWQHVQKDSKVLERIFQKAATLGAPITRNRHEADRDMGRKTGNIPNL
jgi:DNA primase